MLATRGRARCRSARGSRPGRRGGESGRATMAVPTRSATVRPEHRIPPPTGERLPLKANVFQAMQSANTQLLPLFPYMGAGAIVPCGATFHGGPIDWGRFFHTNPITEIVLALGTDGGNVQPGDVHVLAPTH